LLICFGDIEIDDGWGDRVPEDTEEQRKNKMLLKIELENKTKEQEERTKKASTGLYKPPTEEEEAKQKEADEERDKKIDDYRRLSKAKPPIK